MECIHIQMSVLLVLLFNPTSCYAFSPSDPMICYILDGVLIIYCIVATALFFREKLCREVPNVVVSDPSGGIYQELGESKNTDPYEMLQPSKKRRQKKRKITEP
ncbi:CD247 antigen like [Periophthalmus magnuspinnatus]|uniref:CD247 antigen like n=1 Tax=Periophthalmus magnuspinnatus TaxID=409849 RepID=UPI002436E4B3|nr:CD247 antigen like [Periophthalmus magnuspinnatus]